jgi:hypothetical protein
LRVLARLGKVEQDDFKRPFTAITRVQIPSGTPINDLVVSPSCLISPSS